MSLSQLVSEFEYLKKNRRLRKNANLCLAEVGHFALEAHRLLSNETNRIEIGWEGTGGKSYFVFLANGAWSRGVNKAEYILDPFEFDFEWQNFEESVIRSSGDGQLGGIDPILVNRVVYTAVMSWAASVDIFQPSNGLAGTYLEMLIGPTISMLSGREETGAVTIPVPEQDVKEKVTVDISFHGAHQSLAVPTKISTRERISQVYVHARMLESAFPNKYKTILVAGNETNAVHPRGERKSATNMRLKETLVPGTIALYQKYISQIDGIYYLDPPARYINGNERGLPKVGTVGSLLTEDLPSHLLPPKSPN